MILRVSVKTLCLLACFITAVLYADSQVQQPFTSPFKGNSLVPAFIDSLNKHAVLGKKPVTANKLLQRPAGNLAACNTNTFYMHLKADASKKIRLQQVQTTADGNFLLGGTVTLANLEQEGLLCSMSNAGSILTQKQVRINNRPTQLFNVKPLLNGQVVIAGIVKDVADKVFISLLNSDLSVNWLKTLDITNPASTSLDIITDTLIYLAAPSATSVNYCLLDINSNIKWSKQVNVAGLDKIGGIGHNNFSGLLLALNCTVAAKKEVRLFTVNQLNGDIINANIMGDGTAENITDAVSSFNSRIILTGVTKNSSNQFRLCRQMLFNGITTETEHTYTIGEPMDFTLSNAHDNAGDAAAYCFPTNGKLLFLYHFAAYQISPEHSVLYDVPVGASVNSVARSMNDGGYLLALNTAADNECILLKTDSTGKLGGCSYINAAIDYTETLLVANAATGAVASTVNNAGTLAAVTENSTVLANTFDCNETYCPPSPVEDTCLATYFKTFKSNSYVDAFTDYEMMQGNRHLFQTARYNRILGEQNVITYGIKLFDEKGNYIKGNSIYHDGVSVPVFLRPVDDKHAMLVAYSQVDTIPTYTFTLIDDNLQVIWSKSVKTFKDYYFFHTGEDGFVTADKEGNYYYFATTGGVFEKAKVMIYKMDNGGNKVWLKYYEIDASLLFDINATATSTSLIILMEGRQNGSISLRIDKNTGKIVNAFNYKNNADGSVYTRLVKYDGDRVFYATNNKSNELVTGIFDTTGRPIKLQAYGANTGGAGSANVKNGNLYLSYNYATATEFKQGLLKTDADLKTVFANEYDQTFFVGGKIQVGDEGNIYASGNFSWGGSSGSYFDPFLKKYDSDGKLGTCNYKPINITTTAVDPQTTTISFNEINLGNFTPVNIQVDFVPDLYGQQVNALYCSSAPTCNAVKLAGTNKVCTLNQPYTYHAQRNNGCNIKPLWKYDTAYTSLQVIDDSTVTVLYKKFGSTYLYVDLNAGCSVFKDSMLVQVQQSPARFSLGNDTAVCKGSTVTLHAGSGFNSYLWQDGSTDSVFTVSQAGLYYVSVDNVCGEVYKDTVAIKEVLVPAFTIGTDTSVCKEDTLYLQATAGFTKYAWQPAANISGGSTANVSVYTLQDIVVSAVANTVEGCPAYDTVLVSVKEARPVLLGNDMAVCTGDSVTISAGAGYTKYSWSNGSTTAAVVIKQQGLYTVTATDVNGCTASDSVALTLYPLPVPALGNDFDLCKGDQKQLNPGSFNQYLWQDGSTNRFYTVTGIGEYSVTVKDSHLCTASDTVVVRNLLPLPADFLNGTDSICQYEQITLTANRNFSSYLWSTGSEQPAIIADKPGLYVLIVKDAASCTGTDSIVILPKDCFAGVFVPNAFSPNGDGRNDLFRVAVYGSLQSFRLEIFNRFGQLVFSSVDPQKGWDGTYKGVKLPASSFVWQCSYRFADQLDRAKKGNVVLIR